MKSKIEYNDANLNKRLLVLDIDENLVSIEPDDQRTPNRPPSRNNLSFSAQSIMSDSEKGKIGKVKLINLPQYNFQMNSKSVTALNRKKWEAIFKEIVNINEQYGTITKDKQPLISVIFLTNASYTSVEMITNVFHQFYGKDIMEKLIPSSQLDRHFYNNFDQLSLVNKKDKGAFLKAKFKEFQEEYGITDESQVTLIDDTMLNITGAKRQGFFGIHNPTTFSGRDAKTTYTEFGPKVFDKIEEKLQGPRSYVTSLMNQEKNLGNSSI